MAQHDIGSPKSISHWGAQAQFKYHCIIVNITVIDIQIVTLTHQKDSVILEELCLIRKYVYILESFRSNQLFKSVLDI